MKKSSIMLLSGAIAISVLLLSVLVFIGISANKFYIKENGIRTSIEKSGITETIQYDFTDFDKLEFADYRKVFIKQGNTNQITITADKVLIDELNVSNYNDKVIFEYDNDFYPNSIQDKDLKVEITIRELKGIDLKGLGSIYIQDLDSDTLVINSFGNSTIDGDNVSIEQLNLNVYGAATVKLNRIDVKNCDLQISGTANIGLNMTGGILSGRISGVANVRYKGTVSVENVSIFGAGSVKKK